MRPAGGFSYTTLKASGGISGSASGWESLDISAYISGRTTVRFRVTAYSGGSSEWFKFDDVKIGGECS